MQLQVGHQLRRSFGGISQLTVKEFLQRGAVIGIKLDPNSWVDISLRDFCEVGKFYYYLLKKLLT